MLKFQDKPSGSPGGVANRPHGPSPLRRILGRGFGAALALGLSGSAALAQSENEFGPLTSPVGAPTAEKPVLQWVFTLAFLAAILIVAFLNPKRSHQN